MSASIMLNESQEGAITRLRSHSQDDTA